MLQMAPELKEADDVAVVFDGRALGESGGHPSIRKLMSNSYQIITF